MTEQEYYEKLSDEELREILRQDLRDDSCYPLETIMIICEILTKRHPPEISAEESFRRFLQKYFASHEE